MRALPPLVLGASLSVAVACASSPAIQESGGGPTTTGSTGTVSAAPDAGPRSCGLADPDPTCTTCLDARCCTQAATCAADATCLMCLGMSIATEPCTLNHAFQDFRTCLGDRCGGPCMLGSSSSSSSSASTSSSTTTSSSSSSSTSSSTSSSSTSSSSSGGPTSCDQIDGAVGCCDSQGVNWFCDTTMAIQMSACAAGTVCGWDAANGWYDCVAQPGGADPSGTYPLACGF